MQQLVATVNDQNTQLVSHMQTKRPMNVVTVGSKMPVPQVPTHTISNMSYAAMNQGFSEAQLRNMRPLRSNYNQSAPQMTMPSRSLGEEMLRSSERFAPSNSSRTTVSHFNSPLSGSDVGAGMVIQPSNNLSHDRRRYNSAQRQGPLTAPLERMYSGGITDSVDSLNLATYSNFGKHFKQMPLAQIRTNTVFGG